MLSRPDRFAPLYVVRTGVYTWELNFRADRFAHVRLPERWWEMEVGEIRPLAVTEKPDPH